MRRHIGVLITVFLVGFIAMPVWAKKTTKKSKKTVKTLQKKKVKKQTNNEQQNNLQPQVKPEEVDKLKAKIKELQDKLNTLENNLDEIQLQQMQTSAKIDALEPENKGFELKVFKGHGRALQKLNPEISVVGDAAGMFVWSNGKEYTGDWRSGFNFRGLGIHFQSDLDPFSYFKAAISFSPRGVEFGEAYIVWTNVLNKFDITLGKFRQQLGVINRWHKHALDQYDFPLMLKEPFGEGGLNQIGVSFLFLLPSITAQVNSLTLQITNGMNPRAFAGKYFSIPTTLVHYKNYWDLSRNTYLEFGLTGILGFNNARGKSEPVQQKYYMDKDHTMPFVLYDQQGNPVPIIMGPQPTRTVDESTRITAFGGGDLTIQWEPVNQAKYKNFIWRTEFLYGYKQLPADAKGNSQRIHWMGGYSYIQGKVSRRIELGVRGDLVQPFSTCNSKHFIFQIVPYITWYQSPWAHLRLQYNYMNGDQIQPVQRVLLQVVFAAGPHKHDRY